MQRPPTAHFVHEHPERFFLTAGDFDCFNDRIEHYLIVLADPTLAPGPFRIPDQKHRHHQRHQNNRRDFEGTEADCRTGNAEGMDQLHNYAEERRDKQIVRSPLPEQKQKAAERASENGYRKSSAGPCGSAFDDRAMRLGKRGEGVRIHLHEEIYNAHDIPDQRDGADRPETPANTTNSLIVPCTPRQINQSTSTSTRTLECSL